MKTIKKESRVRIPTGRFLDPAENVKEKKRAKAAEQPTPPIQEEPEPVISVLQGDDILALAIKKEDLQKQHIPQPTETGHKPAISQKFIIRKLKPKVSSRKVCHLIAHPTNPDVAAKPIDYSGPVNNFYGSEKILPHHILGTLQDFKRIALARGNTQLAELMHTQPCVMTLISAKAEPKPKVQKDEKRPPWAPPPQHNFLKNWKRHVSGWKKQQEALSEHLQKPVAELLMNAGETYRKIQEERELIDRALPTQHDRKGYNKTSGFWNPLDYLGDEMTGLLMTKTKTQQGLAEPITHIRKPRCIQVETGLSAQKDAWYRYTWDRSLFLVYRRKELQSILAELDFSPQDIDGLEVVGHGQPFSSVTVEEGVTFEKDQESSSEDTDHLDSLTSIPEGVPMPVLGPSLLFCGKPACWIRGSNPEDKKSIGIGVRLTFETLEGEKTSSDLTVVNNGTVAIWYDWRRQPQQDCFRDLKKNRMQRFYFNNREGVILPGETKQFTFFFKSLVAGIFRESWEFRTHPILLGGAVLQVTLHAISLTQDIFRDERKLLKSKLSAHEAVTIVQSVLQELLRGILTPERTASPMDAYHTEEDLFRHRNPRLHYQHQVVQDLCQLWDQYITTPLKAEETQANQGEPRYLRSQLAAALANTGQLNLTHPILEPSPPWQEMEALGDSRTASLSQKPGTGTKNSLPTSIMEKILVEENPDMERTRTPQEWESLPLPKWNFCLEDFRKVLLRPRRGWWRITFNNCVHCFCLEPVGSAPETSHSLWADTRPSEGPEEVVLTLPEEPQREAALIRLNKAALELCQEQKPLQSDLLYQMWEARPSCEHWHSAGRMRAAWRHGIPSAVPSTEIFKGLEAPEPLEVQGRPKDQKSPHVTEVKVTTGKAGKEERKVATQEKKQLGIRDKDNKKGAKNPGKEDRANSKKQKVKEDKKVVKSVSRSRLSSEDPTPDIITPSQEPTVDPLVLDKYTQRLQTEVYGLLDNLVTDLMALADELSPIMSTEEPLRLCS
uniref:MYCBP-associated protein isoform X2 n=1 Tax=Jaculus jaculus TaxID=51337 RepID=UPI001E1B5980|nr:MYCBP-associated protein isoform X2 [Jaculus jaculus]